MGVRLVSRTPKTHRARRLGPAGVVCIALLGLVSAGVHAASPDEETTKARFLFQLLKYVAWPEGALESSTAPLVIGVVADASFAQTVRDVVTSRKARGRGVEVLALAEPSGASVHLLFLTDRGRSSLRKIARNYQGGSVLTVADHFDFPELGGDVGIEMVSGRVSFSINRRKVTRGDFAISSKLMRLASEVK